MQYTLFQYPKGNFHFMKEKFRLILLQIYPAVRRLTFNKKVKVIHFYRSMCLNESVKISVQIGI